MLVFFLSEIIVWILLLRNGKTSTKMSDANSGVLNNHRYLCRKVLMLHAKKVVGAKRKIQQSSSRIANVKKKLKEQNDDSMWTNQLVRRLNSGGLDGELRLPQSSSSCVSKPGCSGLVSTPGDSWEVDSGFSEASPSASGHSSPCAGSCLSTVVALDCEMVGTGPGGCFSELARCSIVDYHGNILYDKYVQPCRPVTDYRTPWSGIQKHHLLNATPFAQAREKVRVKYFELQNKVCSPPSARMFQLKREQI